MHDDEFDEDLRADEDEARKPSNKVELPDSKTVDLANVKFPRRGEFALPDGPAVDALHLGNRDEENEMDAQLTAREEGAQASGATPYDARSSPPGRVSRIMRRNSDGLELPKSQMDIAKLGMRKRDNLGLADTSRNAVQGVL
jgi:hypothetical protein